MLLVISHRFYNSDGSSMTAYDIGAAFSTFLTQHHSMFLSPLFFFLALYRFAVSPQFSCELGLPQGSILSPLLFIIFIIDIVSDPTLTHYKYADDTTLLVESNTASDSLLKASEAIEQVTNWCFRNRIMINVSKSVFLPTNFSKEELDQAQSLPTKARR